MWHLMMNLPSLDLWRSHWTTGRFCVGPGPNISGWMFCQLIIAFQVIYISKPQNGCMLRSRRIWWQNRTQIMSLQIHYRPRMYLVQTIIPLFQSLTHFGIIWRVWVCISRWRSWYWHPFRSTIGNRGREDCACSNKHVNISTNSFWLSRVHFQMTLSENEPLPGRG